MVGAGVFTTSGFALADLGSPVYVLAAWVVGGIVATCGALSYGALARRIPESGGEYTFLSRTFHPLLGFLAGWVSLLAGFTAPIAAAALGLQAYVSSTFGIGGDPRWIGTVAIALAGLLHGMRLSPGVWTQNIAVVTKLVLIVGLVAVGGWLLPGREGSAVVQEVPTLNAGAFAVTLVWISFSYSGWNAAVYVGGEVSDPDRNLPRSLLLGTAIVTLAYLGLNAVFVLAAPEQVAGQVEVGAIAAEVLGGQGLRRGVTLIVALALVTSVSSMVMAGPRVYARMAADGLFPRFFAFTGEVPGRAVLLQVALSIGVVWIADLRALLGYIGFTLGLSAAATVLGLVRLRMREGRERVPVPGYPWVPAVHVGVTLFASVYMAQREWAEAGFGLATLAVGVLLYWARRFFPRRAR